MRRLTRFSLVTNRRFTLASLLQSSFLLPSPFRRLSVIHHPFAHHSSFRSMSTSPYTISPPAGTTVKVALCQLHCTADKSENVRSAEAAIKQAVSQGAQLVVLPEMWNCPYSNASFGPFSEILPSAPSSPSSLNSSLSPTSLAISSFASQYGIWIVAGSIPEKDSEGRLYNTCLIVNPSGEFIAKHRKVHLFDIDIPGQMTFKESETLTGGSSFTFFDSPFGRIGIGICYDIRFPEYAACLSNEGCQILIYPGAFNTTTGPLHWELLARSRAVDFQCFVLVCSPARNPEASYQAWGHSSIVSPWGKVLATTGHEAAVVMGEIAMDEVKEFRQRIPTSIQKRKDLYKLERLV